MKRATLINDINEGGLKMPHIESMIEAQRNMCIQITTSTKLEVDCYFIATSKTQNYL